MNTIRMLGRRVEYLGKTYPLSLIEAAPDANGMWHVSVTPFERETAATPYHGGTVRIVNPDNPHLPYTPSTIPPHLELL